MRILLVFLTILLCLVARGGRSWLSTAVQTAGTEPYIPTPPGHPGRGASPERSVGAKAPSPPSVP